MTYTRIVDERWEIRELLDASAETLERINLLIPQLSSSAGPMDAAALSDVARFESNHLLLYCESADPDNVLGMLTLVVFPIPTGVRAWIEDVVVDASARGGGVGGELIRCAVELAERLGAKSIDLTSRPDREAANRLYVNVGFERRSTNVYRFKGA